jgi:hypothetical protein
MVRKKFLFELDRETPAFLTLRALGTSFELGKRDAADMAAIVCDENADRPLPRWAISEFARRARENFGLSTRQIGRGAGTAAYETYYMNLIVAAVTAAEQHSDGVLRRKSKYKAAQVLLRMHGAHKSVEAIKKAYREARKRHWKPSERLVRDFSYMIEIEYEVHAEGVPI